MGPRHWSSCEENIETHVGNDFDISATMSLENATVLLKSIIITLLYILGPLLAAQAHESREHKFFRVYFERQNGRDNNLQLNQTYEEIVKGVDHLRKRDPHVTLGGMLALIYFESNYKLAYYNTIDKENRFGQKGRLKQGIPFAEQPFARYAYQLGIVPLHTSLFRPCMAGPQQIFRQTFDLLANEAGFVVSADEMDKIKMEFNEVCAKVLHGAISDKARAVDYYILNIHSIFHVPANRTGRDMANLNKFPFYLAQITAPLFFAEIEAAGRSVTDDRTAICAFGGTDMKYCKESKRADQILKLWASFRG